jgi:hypothetical protein
MTAQKVASEPNVTNNSEKRREKKTWVLKKKRGKKWGRQMRHAPSFSSPLQISGSTVGDKDPNKEEEKR